MSDHYCYYCNVYMGNNYSHIPFHPFCSSGCRRADHEKWEEMAKIPCDYCKRKVKRSDLHEVYNNISYCSPKCLNDHLMMTNGFQAYNLFFQQRDVKRKEDERVRQIEKSRSNAWDNKNSHLIKLVGDFRDKVGTKKDVGVYITIVFALGILYGIFELTLERIDDYDILKFAIHFIVNFLFFFTWLPYLFFLAIPGIGLYFFNDILLGRWLDHKRRLFNKKKDELISLRSEYAKSGVSEYIDLNNTKITSEIKAILPIMGARSWGIILAVLYAFLTVIFSNMFTKDNYFMFFKRIPFSSHLQEDNAESEVLTKSELKISLSPTPTQKGWTCLCYTLKKSQRQKQSTACRESTSECESLYKKIQFGSRSFVKGSATQCRTVYGDNPWSATSSSNTQWHSSKSTLNGWWTSQGCFLP